MTGHAILTVLALALVYVAGIATGVAAVLGYRAARMRLRARAAVHTYPMTRRTGLLVAVGLVCMIITAAAVLANVAQARQRDADRQCVTDYNRADGQARDERATASRAASQAERRAIRRLLAEDLSGIALSRRLATVRLDSLERVSEAQVANPYPEPDECSDGSYDGPTPTPTQE